MKHTPSYHRKLLGCNLSTNMDQILNPSTQLMSIGLRPYPSEPSNRRSPGESTRSVHSRSHIGSSTWATSSRDGTHRSERPKPAENEVEAAWRYLERCKPRLIRCFGYHLCFFRSTDTSARYARILYTVPMRKSMLFVTVSAMEITPSETHTYSISKPNCPIVKPKALHARSSWYRYARGDKFRLQYASVYYTPGDILQNHLLDRSALATVALIS